MTVPHYATPTMEHWAELSCFSKNDFIQSWTILFQVFHVCFVIPGIALDSSACQLLFEKQNGKKISHTKISERGGL